MKAVSATEENTVLSLKTLKQKQPSHENNHLNSRVLFANIILCIDARLLYHYNLNGAKTTKKICQKTECVLSNVHLQFVTFEMNMS